MTPKKVKKGDPVPDFSLPDQHGKQINIRDFTGKRNLVLFFYPKDASPGCTKEACSFRNQLEAFNELDAEVMGISGQSVESHQKFARKYGLHYPLLSDEGDQVRKRFGVSSGLFGMLPGRVTYVIDKSGKVVHIFNSQFRVLQHVEDALEALKEVSG